MPYKTEIKNLTHPCFSHFSLLQFTFPHACACKFNYMILSKNLVMQRKSCTTYHRLMPSHSPSSGTLKDNPPFHALLPLPPLFIAEPNVRCMKYSFSQFGSVVLAMCSQNLAHPLST